MQPSNDESVQKEIKLIASAGDYQVPGFSEDYAAYLEGIDDGAGFFGGLAMAVGGVIALVGFSTAVFGPETITYSRMAGPTLLQYVQMYPGPIFSVGGALVALCSHLYGKRAVTREVFLLSHYKLISRDGRDISGEVKVRYLDGDKFNMAIN
ncbi:hypothetical protein [Pseudomonas alloputida]|uniref:hypothetical protein n=1 Tax=Pseudomonas TaxID=286 RepID=UPI003EEB7F7A